MTRARPLFIAIMASTLLLPACDGSRDADPSPAVHTSPSPAKQPPAKQPPAEQPPTKRPPAEQPPAEQPPAAPGPTETPAARPTTTIPVAEAPPRSRVPKKLTGTWGGGSWNDSTGGRSYRFTSDGTVTFAFRGAETTGTVVVEDHTMTLHFGATKRTMSWSYVDCDDPAGYGFAFKSLVLDGLSYVQDC
ncbi:hypothetical protein ACQP2F_11270 [Actinoplanes sp. CA-030573]|uniref:hypothetical protein n=1 Tax=Actinoplanes sp. CA-030573 TaxID=3239898 RepID=UPI003D92339F